MAFKYSGNPSESEADFVRFAIGDTNSAAPILQDAEINYIVSSTADTTVQIGLLWHLEPLLLR